MIEGDPCIYPQPGHECDNTEACMAWCSSVGYRKGGYCVFKDKVGLCTCLACP